MGVRLPKQRERNIYMTEKEIKLIHIIQEHENPRQAMTVAVEIILSCLERPESFEEQALAVLRELA